mgnify:CR=1 FL=1
MNMNIRHKTNFSCSRELTLCAVLSWILSCLESYKNHTQKRGRDCVQCLGRVEKYLLLTTISIFSQNSSFRRKFRQLAKISIFAENFNYGEN